MPSSLRRITLGGGCFWSIEAVFEQVGGVTAVESGYCNGHVVAPRYEQVCTGTTGHAEVVELTYDAQIIPLREILEIFFAVHDPTTPDRQGSDVGPQYRSGIYVENDEDEALARQVVAAVDARRPERVVTEIRRRQNYWRAEDYHRHFCGNHPNSGYCSLIVAPKVRRVQRQFAGLARNG